MSELTGIQAAVLRIARSSGDAWTPMAVIAEMLRITPCQVHEAAHGLERAGRAMPIENGADGWCVAVLKAYV